MKKKKSKGWIWVVVVVAVLVLAGILLPQLLSIGNLNAGAQRFEATKVERGDIRVTVHGTGAIEAMDEKTVTAAASGRIDAVNVENGDAVKAGDVIARLNADAANDKIQSLKDQITAQDAAIAKLRAAPGATTLYAPVDCRVKAIYAKKGQDVNVSMSASGALMLLSTDGRMKVRFTPAEGAELAAGGSVKFVVGGKTVSGFISEVPDGTTNEAEAVMLSDSYAVGAQATVKDSKGNEIGSGALEVNRPLLVTANSGKVYYIYVKTNQKVDARNKLIKLDGAVLDANFDTQLLKRQQLQDDLDQAYADLSDLTILAPADGVVTGLSLKEGGMAQEGMQVCSIQESTGFKLVVSVDELDVPGIRIGQTADVKIDALPEQEATAEVVKINPVGVKANDVTTYDITLKVAAPAGTLVGMSASADIETAMKAGALLVPVEALHTVDGKTFVYKALPVDIRPSASPSATGSDSAGASRFARLFGSRGGADASEQREQVEVTVGLVNDSQAEILSGLNEGDEVAVPLAQSSIESMFSMGGGRGQGGAGN
jgi:HlyD family secretion protein